MAKIQIGNRVFVSKEAAQEYFKEMQGRWLGYTPIVGEDSEMLHDLITLHKWASEKIGVGIRYFSVRLNKPWDTKSFWITRVDDTETDFSYIKCLSQPTNWKLADLKQACRESIVPDILLFRDTHISLPCPITGVILTPTNSHVHHDYPAFNEIFKLWLEETGTSEDDWELCGYEDGATKKVFKNKADALSFAMFHNNHARLRLLSIEAHTKLPKKQEARI